MTQSWQAAAGLAVLAVRWEHVSASTVMGKWLLSCLDLLKAQPTSPMLAPSLALDSLRHLTSKTWLCMAFGAHNKPSHILRVMLVDDLL